MKKTQKRRTKFTPKALLRYEVKSKLTRAEEISSLFHC